jgi:hypothetical protein
MTAAVGVVGWRYTKWATTQLEKMYENNLKAAVHLANAQDARWRLRYGFPQLFVLTALEERRKIADEESQALCFDQRPYQSV